jgi:hypothetical protein
MNRRQRKEARDLVAFIDAHGGRLAPFRAYRQDKATAAPAVPPAPTPTPDEDDAPLGDDAGQTS